MCDYYPLTSGPNHKLATYPSSGQGSTAALLRLTADMNVGQKDSSSQCVCVCVEPSIYHSNSVKEAGFDMHKRQKGKIIICSPLEHFVNKGYWGGHCGVAGRGEEGDKVLGHTLWGITWMCRQRFNGAREWWQPRWNCSVHVHWPNTINHKKESAIGFIDIACPCYCIMIIQSRK